MKTYDTIQMLRRLAFGATLLTATALLPACDDDPAAPDEELTTDPGTSVQPETLRFISYNILEGMKLDKAQNFDNFVDWVKEKNPDFMALCECNAFTEESLTALAGRYGHPYAILCKESGFPVGLTSKYPIELRNRLSKTFPSGTEPSTPASRTSTSWCCTSIPSEPIPTGRAQPGRATPTATGRSTASSTAPSAAIRWNRCG